MIVSEGLQGLRSGHELSISLPLDIADEVCYEIEQPLLKGLLQTTISTNNEASKVLIWYRVSYEHVNILL